MKFCLIWILLLMMSWSKGEVDYTGYQVYRVLPDNKTQLAELQSLQNLGYDFWSFRGVGHPTDIMVSPEQEKNLTDFLETIHVPYKIVIEDVQTLINREKNETLTWAKKVEGFSFKRYYRINEINVYLKELGRKYKQVQVVQGGRSYENRSITGVKVSYKPGNPGIFIEGGIHAREWIAPATVLYILTELLTTKNPGVRNIAENYDWYLFPSVNPDGYEFTHTEDRMWRKTRKPYGECYGADANRNWDNNWGGFGASSYECSDTFEGPKPFSEPETSSLSKFITKVGQNLMAYISLHSFSQLLLIPYGYTYAHLDNYRDLYNIGHKAVNTIKAVHGKKYETGATPDLLYIASGGSMDWVKKNFKIPITYTFELRDEGEFGFYLPADQIIPTGEEILASFVTIIKEAEKLNYHKLINGSQLT